MAESITRMVAECHTVAGLPSGSTAIAGIRPIDCYSAAQVHAYVQHEQLVGSGSGYTMCQGVSGC